MLSLPLHRRAALTLLNSFILSVPKEQIEHSRVFFLVLDFLRHLYEKEGMTMDKLTELMYRISVSTEAPCKEPWLTMNTMGDLYYEAQIGYITMDSYMEIFHSFLAPLFTLGLSFMSETRDFKYYLDLDAQCIADRSVIFHRLFPAWPHYFINVEQPDGHFKAVYLEDAQYYYRYISGFDYTYDIFAQWSLEEEAYAEEVKRVHHLFAEHRDGYDYKEMTYGDYRCLILYTWMEPFQPVTDNYDHYIFAYNDESNIVRYIYCSSLENGVDQPYYLSLPWE